MQLSEGMVRTMDTAFLAELEMDRTLSEDEWRMVIGELARRESKATRPSAAQPVQSAPVRGSRRVVVGGGLAAAACVVAVVAAARGPYVPSKLSATTTPAAAIAISARELGATYAQNEIAADDRFKGRRMVVTGTVESISRDFLDEPFLMLQGANEFASVKANLIPAEVSTAAALSKGQQITVDCEGSGMFVGIPVLAHCSIR